jgi:dTDP-4-dehydrorhamnose 3,5-epimerase
MNVRLSRKNLTEPASEKYFVQSYEKSPTIDGVVIKDISCFTDDGGYFMELGRFDKGLSGAFDGFEAKQMSYSQVLPGSIKAFHLHFNQEDIWFVPPHERLLVVLSDQRENSPTRGVTMRFVLGAGKSRLAYIPRGVAHGGANLWQQPASIIYFVNQQFNLEDPDEGRLPWDFLGLDVWEIAKG